jgi:hypothetical protein
MSTPVTTAPKHLWQVARDYIVSLFDLFGAPEQIAAQHALDTKTRKLLLQWLRTGEAIIRQLLLIEASALDPLPPPRPRRTRKPRTRRLVHFHADKPEDWRVSFRIFHLPPRRGGSVEPSETKGDVPRTLSGASGDEGFHNPWPIAERAEALLRAFNDPIPYARRLARRLRAEPRRAKALTTLPPNWERCLFDAYEFREAASAKLKHFEPG